MDVQPGALVLSHGLYVKDQHRKRAMPEVERVLTGQNISGLHRACSSTEELVIDGGTYGSNQDQITFVKMKKFIGFCVNVMDPGNYGPP